VEESDRIKREQDDDQPRHEARDRYALVVEHLVQDAQHGLKIKQGVFM
jgi:hypothetical protein